MKGAKKIRVIDIQYSGIPKGGKDQAKLALGAGMVIFAVSFASLLRTNPKSKLSVLELSGVGLGCTLISGGLGSIEDFGSMFKGFLRKKDSESARK